MWKHVSATCNFADGFEVLGGRRPEIWRIYRLFDPGDIRRIPFEYATQKRVGIATLQVLRETQYTTIVVLW